MAAILTDLRGDGLIQLGADGPPHSPFRWDAGEREDFHRSHQ